MVDRDSGMGGEEPRQTPPSNTQRGSADAVVAYLRANDLPRDTELEQLAWRMMNKAFYLQVIAALRSRMVFVRPLWAFALYHQYVRNYYRIIRWYLHSFLFARVPAPL
jgi:hypothetical protein